MSDCIPFEDSICNFRRFSHIQDRISFFFNWIFKLRFVNCYFLVDLRERVYEVTCNLRIANSKHSSDALLGSILIVGIDNKLVCGTEKSSHPWCESSLEINSIGIFNHTLVKLFLRTYINNNSLFLKFLYHFL